MYDVHGKSVNGENKGRMQKAVDAWEESAKLAAGKKTGHLDDETIAEGIDIKSVISNNIKEINENKKKKAENNVIYSDSGKKTISEHYGPEKNLNSGASKAKAVENNKDKSHDETDDSLERIIEDQDDLRSSLLLRFVGCLVCAIGLIWLAAAPIFKVELPPFINATKHPSYFLSANLILLVLVGIIGFPVAVKGIASLFKLKPDTDSIASLAFYAALIGGAYTLYNYTVADVPPAGLPATEIFAACAAASVTFNFLGKVFLVARVKNNLEFIAENQNDVFYAASSVDSETAQKILQNFEDMPTIAIAHKAKISPDILEESYAQTPSDRTSRVLAPAALIFALILAVCEVVLKKDIPGAFIAFTAVCSIASPILLEIGVSVPFYRSCKRLLKQKTLLTGADTVTEFSETDAIVADANLLFSENSARIVSIKTFSHYSIDEAVVYASSIAYEGNSPLKDAFMSMFADASLGEKLRKKAEKIVYEDERGLSAVIDNKLVLLGNRGLLRHHFVEAPSRNFELRSADNGKEIVYLAVDGKLCAMFVVEYGLDDDRAAIFKRLHRYDVCLLLESSDPNITPLLLEEKCDAPVDSAAVLGAREMQLLGKAKRIFTETVGLAFNNIVGFANGIISCIKLRGTFKANTLLQTVLSVVGMLIVAYCALFAGGAATVAPAYVLAYQLICAVPVLLICLLRRN